MPAQHRKRPIDLLGEHCARQFVGHRHGGERNQQIRPLPPCFRQSGVTTNDEDQILPLHFSLFKKGCELMRIEGFSGRVEKNLFGGRMFLPDAIPISPLRPDFRHRCGSIMPRPPNIFIGKGIRLRVLWLSYVVKIDLQTDWTGADFAARFLGAATGVSGGISTGLPSRQSRSRS